ncbi:DUF2637 domain-containing protein [Streptomyces sp. enrichment culture]|uniref:DUF2637 domain-containing protein n=1 Tax=Streptomyces sp. enrichment culture TaxID=1795815 RepID=UPI003F543262
MYDEAGHGRHRAPADDTEPLVPDMAWDEELAVMLQDALEEQLPGGPPHPDRRGDGVDGLDETPAAAPVPGSPLGNLRDITEELPALKETRAGRSHRRARPPRPPRGPRGVEAVSYVTAALATVIASAVSLLSGIVAYDPLRVVAVTRLESGVVAWWPLLVFGPWLVASLSVLRAALHQRRALHAWCVVLGFSLIAVFLCVLQAPGTVVDVAAAALPGLASLACFQQLVRQITLTRPPRRRAPRHRVRPESRQQAEPDRKTGTGGTPDATTDTPAPAPAATPPAPAPAPAPAQVPAPAGARYDARREPRRPAPAPAPPPRTPEPPVTTYVISNGRPLRARQTGQPRSFPAPRTG